MANLNEIYKNTKDNFILNDKNNKDYCDAAISSIESDVKNDNLKKNYSFPSIGVGMKLLHSIQHIGIDYNSKNLKSTHVLPYGYQKDRHDVCHAIGYSLHSALKSKGYSGYNVNVDSNYPDNCLIDINFDDNNVAKGPLTKEPVSWIF